MTLAQIGESLHGCYTRLPLGALGVTPSLACRIDLHMNCRGCAIGGGVCSCECHDEGEYR